MPVTHVKQPNGKDAFIFLRLLSVAFFTVIHPESKESDSSTILGGFILRVGYLQSDASIANKLNNLKREFTLN